MPEKKGAQGTGKHPHKSTEEPFPHTKESGETEGQEQGGSSQRGAGTARAKEENKQTKGNESSDLKEREYRDSQGNIHHHTHTYEEQHKNKK